MEPVSTNNVTSFFNQPMYKKMLKKVDNDLKLKGSLEWFYLITDTGNVSASTVMLNDRYAMETGKGDYSEIFKSANTFVFYEDIDRLIEITAFSYFEDSEEYLEHKQLWDSKRLDKVEFSRILDIQPWSAGAVIDDLRTYLDKLFELGFRLVRSDPLRDYFKKFYVNKDNVLVCIEIDYTAITSAIEINILHQLDD